MALKELKPLAEQGNEWMRNTLGWMYDRGEDTPRDDLIAYM